MLKKLIESLFKQSNHHHHQHKYQSSSDWSHLKHDKHDHLGHHYYKKKKKSGSFLSSFLSS